MDRQSYETLKNMVSSAMLIALAGLWLHHLIYITVSGGIILVEHNRSIAIFECVFTIAIITLAIERFIYYTKNNKRARSK